VDKEIPTSCRNCGGPQTARNHSGKARSGGHCHTCEKRDRCQALDWQERDYLHGYLHTCNEEDTWHTRMLRRNAERLGID
jgi:hypothetical protein